MSVSNVLENVPSFPECLFGGLSSNLTLPKLICEFPFTSEIIPPPSPTCKWEEIFPFPGGLYQF